MMTTEEKSRIETCMIALRYVLSYLDGAHWEIRSAARNVPRDDYHDQRVEWLGELEKKLNHIFLNLRDYKIVLREEINEGERLNREMEKLCASEIPPTGRCECECAENNDGRE